MIIALDQCVRVVLTALAFMGFYLGATLLSWCLPPVLRWSRGPLVVRRARCRTLVRGAFVFFHDYMRVMRLIRFDPRLAEVKPPPGPYVLIANHPTLVDVTALMATYPDLVTVVKEPLFKGVSFGGLLRACDHIESEREGGMAGGRVVLDAVERLRAGVPVLIFPEGTRSPEGGLGAFRRGAFEIAARAGATVVPALITCDPPVLAKEAPWYRAPRTPSRYRIVQMPVIDPAAWKGDTRAMASHVHAMYARTIGSGDAPASAVAPDAEAVTV
ncbi:MAG: 1-acyl-sn-glycerol-3-phosphate acyltransferase [Lysobacterales bacterium]|nr:MAG: 1-acyl-sn-glycerol-3-phosphate acyltransferase [Xanthomonadales bacterium]